MAVVFPSTQWTLVRKLADPQTRDDAFQSLCKKYWGPVYAFLCQRFQSADAEDITQEFFFVVMKRELFQRADSTEGKLRSWLLKSLNYCLANRSRTENSVKRGGQVKIVGMQDEELRMELQGIAASATSPTDAFDKAWLNSILHNTLQALSKQYCDTGKQLLFEALQPWLIGDQDESCQAEAASKCGSSLLDQHPKLLSGHDRHDFKTDQAARLSSFWHSTFREHHAPSAQAETILRAFLGLFSVQYRLVVGAICALACMQS